MTNKRIFNPFKEAIKDQTIMRQTLRRSYTRFCCKCNQEKTSKGGHYPNRKGGARNTTIERFICAECLAKD